MPSANSVLHSQFLYRYFFCDILFNIFLRLFNRLVFMFLLPGKHDKGGLAFPIYFEGINFGCCNSYFAAGIFFYKI